MTYRLPPLKKKIVYLDQFALSNMMKELNPKVPAHKKGTLDGFWLRLFERVHSLCKMQLVVCPDSYSHWKESIPWQFYPELRRMYELLSGGVSFEDYATIQMSQICAHAERWLKRTGGRERGVELSTVLQGEPNAWQGRFIISARIGVEERWIDDLRRTRDSSCKQMSQFFEEWGKQKRSFEESFETEVMSFGKMTVAELRRDENDLSAFLLVASLDRVFQKNGIPREEVRERIEEYLLSPSLRRVPFLRISAMLYAAMAWKAASSGQTRPPTRGTVEDVRMISALLPYCDAMFIDNECRAYLTERPLRDEIRYGTAVFSLKTRNAFLQWLDQIELGASVRHVKKVEEVYGSGWRQPYVNLYGENANTVAP